MYEDEGFFAEDIHNVLRTAYELSKGKLGKAITAADVGMDEEDFAQVVEAARKARHAQPVGGPNQLLLSQAGLGYAARILGSSEEPATFGDE
jgi:hypothetical protein